MIETLTDIKDIFRQIFSDNKPRLIVPTDLSADTKPAPLTDRIVHETGMMTEFVVSA